MQIISHRGNLYGPSPTTENTPEAILAAIDQGFKVEVDIWFDKANKIFLLGHDKPEHNIGSSIYDTFTYEQNRKIIWHAKTVATLARLRPDNMLAFFLERDFHVFVHDRDEATITSRGYIWAQRFNNSPLLNDVIYVGHSNLEQYLPTNDVQIGGLCTDYPVKFREILENSRGPFRLKEEDTKI